MHRPWAPPAGERPSAISADIGAALDYRLAEEVEQFTHERPPGR
jgi:hypothetical protein